MEDKNTELFNLITIINNYIYSVNSGLHLLSTHDLKSILYICAIGNKVSAIKKLRMCCENRSKDTIIQEGRGNTFEAWLEDNNITFTNSQTLGLKEARDIVTFLSNNLPLILTIISTETNKESDK